jgi:serine/threonine protein kinase
MKDMVFDRQKLRFIKKDNGVGNNNEVNELVGTAEYVAPETLENKNVDISVDIWALGCIIYLFLQGRTPFKDKTNLQIFDNILHKSVEFKHEIDDVSKDLIEKLLVKDPSKRLGCGAKGSENDFEALKAHPFFEGIDWENLPNINPPVGNICYNPKPANLHSFSPNARRNNCLLSPVKQARKKDTMTEKDLQPFKINLITIEPEDKIIFECKHNITH